MPDGIITASIAEEIIDQLAVGNHIIQIGSLHGAIANIATAQDKPTVCSHSTPILIRTRLLEKLLDREEAVKEAIAVLQSGQSVEFYSPAGYGKTFLLSYLAHNHQATSPFGDGVISLSPHHPYIGDILQSIWEAFYESDIPYKPTNKQISQQIHDKRALVVLDESKLIKHEMEELMNAARSCTFLIASSTSRIQQRGRSMVLPGLSNNDALVLVEDELQRSLQKAELPAAKSLCAILKGHPMHLRLAIASMVEDGKSLAEVVSQLPTNAPSNFLIQQIVASLSKSQRKILALLAIMDGVGLKSEQVITITQLPDATVDLEALHRRHLVQLDGFYYSISKTIVEALPPQWKVMTAPQENAIAYFTNWAEHHRQQPKSLLLEIDAMAQILDVAVRACRWREVLRLVKAVEGSLVLSRRWSLWEQVLQQGLQASQAEQDQVAEAWALHQLGTRALCLEEYASAINYLTKAIQLRKSLGDKMGVSLTRHNLHLLKILTREGTKLDSIVDTDTHKNSPKIFSAPVTDVEESPLPLTEDSNGQLSSSQHLLTRMNIVIENTGSSAKPSYKSVLLSPKGVITTGILAAGGLLMWFNWHRFTHVNSPPSTTVPKATAKPSPIAKRKPKATAKPSPIAEPTSTGTATLSPIIEPIPTVNPPIKPPIVEFQKPITNTRYKVNNRKNSKRTLQSPPVPTATPTPTQAPTPTTQLREFTPQPTVTPSTQLPLTPHPTPTPTAAPTPTTPFSQLTPQPTPTPTGVPTPTTQFPEFTPQPTPTPTGAPTPTTQFPEFTPQPTPTPTGASTPTTQLPQLTPQPTPAPTGAPTPTTQLTPQPTPTLITTPR
ncbi:MAG: hypothetical protein DSM106950_24500 [Stigonema ocellatum SAG 48.90 = DSM 106950]|nr:hypothetical protein [Stigonema ocellatum SAG 48.90 = DSM 106950]